MKTQLATLLRPRFLFASSILASTVASTSHAFELASEDFSSYTAPQNLNGAGGGSGWNGGWLVGAPSIGFLNEVRNNSSFLSYPDVTANGGNYANLASGYGGPSENFLRREIDLAGSFSPYATTNAGGFPVAGAENTVLWGSFLYENVAGLQMWLQQQTETNATTTEVFDMPTTGSDSFLLFRIEYGEGNADTMTIWSNPDLTTWTPSAPATSTTPDDYSFSILLFYVPNSTNEGRIDNIRFGSQAADVIGAGTTPTPYEAWAVSKGLNPLTDGAPSFDKDNDGSENIEEYAFFTDPKSSTSIPVMEVAADGADLTLTYSRANLATDVDYVAKGSTDLSSFTTTGVSDAPTGISDADTTQYRVSIPKGADPAKFLRVEVMLAP